VIVISIRITIIGLGLIGGSFAKSIRENTNNYIIAYDQCEDTLKKALSEEIIDEGYTSAELAVSTSDLIIMCLYPEATMKFIENNGSYIKSDAIVTDTAGLKTDIVSFFKMRTHKDQIIEYIGGHPIAGSEKSGYENSNASIFKNASYILTPHEGNSKAALGTLSALLKQIGFASVTEMSPEKHDERIAYTSHLPHIIASALLNQMPDQSLIGGSFRDATRVGQMNAELWQELVLTNKVNVLKCFDQFKKQLQLFELAILENDKKTLTDLFNKPNLTEGGIDNAHK